MGIMLSRQSGRLHQMCTCGGGLRKLTLCCKSNERKLIFRYSSHYGRRRGEELRALLCTTQTRWPLMNEDSRPQPVLVLVRNQFSCTCEQHTPCAECTQDKAMSWTHIQQRRGCKCASARNVWSLFVSQPSNSCVSIQSLQSFSSHLWSEDCFWLYNFWWFCWIAQRLSYPFPKLTAPIAHLLFPSLTAVVSIKNMKEINRCCKWASKKTVKR